jgi:hypothetical protein
MPEFHSKLDPQIPLDMALVQKHFDGGELRGALRAERVEILDKRIPLNKMF